MRTSPDWTENQNKYPRVEVCKYNLKEEMWVTWQHICMAGNIYVFLDSTYSHFLCFKMGFMGFPQAEPCGISI